MYKKIVILTLLVISLLSLGWVTETKSLDAKNKTSYDGEFIYEDSHHNVMSEYGDLGEKMKFLKETQEGLIFKGKYASGVHFFRVFNVNEEQVTLIYEVNSLQKEEFNTFSKEFKSDVEFEQFVILKKPFEKGNTWDGNEITNTYSQNNKKYIEVTYSNGNVYVFEEGKGISEIHYTLPEEIMKTYSGTLSSITAKERDKGE